MTQLRSVPPETESDSDEALLARFQDRGDIGALDELIRRYSPRLRGLLANMLRGSPEEMADAEQEVFLQLVRKAHTYRGRSSFSTFFYSLARNRVLDLIRSQSRYDARHGGTVEFDMVRTDHAGPEEQLLNFERRRAVQRALLTLEPDDRFLLHMKEVEGMRVSELARVARLGENTVKSRLMRARRKLANQLGEEER